MSASPYKLRGPTCLSFSGGRTSAFMLRQVLDHNDDLADLTVCFANTGKEHPATLEFVHECGKRWGVDIVWLEYRWCSETGAQTYVVVNHETASRDGEPFSLLIQKKKYLPNPVTRFCTSELKIRTMNRYLRSLGWGNDGQEWDQMVGIRADEQRRVSKIRARGRSSESRLEVMQMPLADAGVTVQDVGAFWAKQDFDLGLPSNNGRTYLGNCDLCFLKGAHTVYSIIATDRRLADWWAGQEQYVTAEGSPTGGGARWRNDRPTYQQMRDYSGVQLDFFPDVDESIDCFCGD